MRTIHDVLLDLGARPGRDGRDGQLSLDLSLLDLTSVFGGELAGDAVVQVSSAEAFAFLKPPELAQCETLWLPGVDTVEALSQAVADAHEHVRTRLDDDQETLRRLGFKPKLIAPEPRARARLQVEGRAIVVVVDQNANLTVESVDGARLPAETPRTIGATDDLDGDDAIARLETFVARLEPRAEAKSEAFDVDVDVDMDGDGDGDGDGAEEPPEDTQAGALPPPSRAPASEGGAHDWDDEGSRTVARHASAETNANRPLSEDQIAELAAAVGGEDDSDEGPAAAGASGAAAHADDAADSAEHNAPLLDASEEAAPILAEGDDDEEEDPTLSVPAQGSPPPVPQDDDDEPRTAQFNARKPSSLLSALDTGGASVAAAEAAASGFDDDDDDYDEPTSRGVPQVKQVTRQDDAQVRVTASPFAAPPDSMEVDDFPALPADSEDQDPSPTSVTAPRAAEMMSNPPTAQVRPTRTSDDEVEAIARGFDDGEGPAARPSRPGLTVENIEPATNIPTKATVSRPAESLAEPPMIAPPAPPPPPAGNAPATATAALPTASVGSPPPSFAGLDLDVDVQTRAVNIAGVRALARRTTDEDFGEDDPAALEARAGALEEEARALRERAAELRTRMAARDAAAAAAAAAAAVVADVPPTRPPTVLQPIGTSASGPNASSLPVMASMEVEEVSAFSGETAVVAAAAEAEPVPVAAPAVDGGTEGRASDEGVSLAEVQAALGDIASLPGEATQVGALVNGGFSEIKHHSGEGDVFSTASPEARLPDRGAPPRRPPPTLLRSDEEEEDSLEVAIGNSGRPTDKRPQVQPEVAAEAMARSPIENLAASFDDDLAAEDALVEQADVDGTARDMRVQAGEGPGSIGLVVEDAKARDRLRKHLSPRFKELIEAPDASTVASLPDIRRLDALVFVRPRPDDATRSGIELLVGAPKHPRILVISSDVRFDEIPGVSLRLPLGQRASEVAQQVLDGLKSLGVQCLEGDSAG